MNTKSFQHRFDRALEDLALTFTDAILLIEELDKRLERTEHSIESLQDRIKYLENKIDK